MKIAILAPSPVPFVIGGAENLWQGLQDAFNAMSGVECDLIKLPTPERSLPELMASYRQFLNLDVSHFDAIISTKYPAWMAQHRNHIVYLQHTLRGLYDTYPGHLASLPHRPELEAIGLPVHVCEALLDPDNFFVDARILLDSIQGAIEKYGADAPIFAFPGPLSRAMVHALDRWALTPPRVRVHNAISTTVARRHNYFPPGVKVQVMHHPTRLKGFRTGTQQYVFSASRLDRPKRMDWVIQAWRRSGITLPLHIAGTGPDLNRLQALAGNDPHIQFLGRITDSELVEAYANASCVVFVPRDEDYGLISLEAMLAAKPVITTADGGGTNELVEHRISGFVCTPNVDALAQALRDLHADLPHAQQMGAIGRDRARRITWTSLASKLVNQANTEIAHDAIEVAPAVLRKVRPKVVVANTFQMLPVNSGGRMRLWALYTGLARYMDVHAVNLGDAGDPHFQRTPFPCLTEEIVPPPPPFIDYEWRLHNMTGASVRDLAAIVQHNRLPQWREALQLALRKADLLVCAHPYAWPMARELWQGAMCYEAHNVEADLKSAIYGHVTWAINRIEEAERQCTQAARVILACSDEDARRLRTLYQPTAEMHILPNGVDLSQPFIGEAQRSINRNVLGIKQPLAFFIGSAHGPNLQAVHLIIDAARALPEWLFVIGGSVNVALQKEDMPANVVLRGVISEQEKRIWIEAAHVALNPMLSGSGTNLKIAEYAAKGVLCVSTEFGARGGVFQPGRDYLAIKPENLVPALVQAIGLPSAEVESMTRSARRQAEATLDWRHLADRFAHIVQKVLV